MAEEIGNQLAQNIGDAKFPGIGNFAKEESTESLPKLQEEIEVPQNEIKKEENIRMATHKKEYPFDQVPADLELAKTHGKANMVYGALLESEKNVERKVCECCFNPVDLNKIRICCDKQDLYHLGSGFPLYFEFVLNGMILVLIMFLINGIYNIITNLDASDCDKNSLAGYDENDPLFCVPTFTNRISQINKRFTESQLQINEHLNLAVVVVMLIAMYYYRRQARATSDECDKSQQTPADYTLEIINLPSNVSEEELKKYLQEQIMPDLKIKIVKVVRGYIIGEYVKLDRLKTTLIHKLQKPDVKNREALEVKLTQIKDRMDVIEKNSNKELTNSSFAFVTFESELHARAAVDRLKMGGFTRFFSKLGMNCCSRRPKLHNKRIVGNRAPEPSDIAWDNLGTPASVRYKRRFITTLISAILILACFAVICAISVEKEELGEENSGDETSTGAQILSIVIAFLIMFINGSLAISIRQFASYEQHTTFTNCIISIADRLAVATFLNTAITVLVTGAILETLWKQAGLMDDILTIFIVNAAFGPLFSIFNPWHIQRWCKRRNIINQGAECKLTQKEVNGVFEGPPIDMAQRYANVMKTLWLTAFYGSVFPLGIPISLAGLIFTYWVDKYMLLRRHARPSQLGHELTFAMIESLEWVPILYALGNVIFTNLIADDDATSDIKIDSAIALGLSVASLILPCRLIVKKCCPVSDDGETGFNSKEYGDVRKFFNNDYDIANPVTHVEALDKWLDFIENQEGGKYKKEEITNIRAEMKAQKDALKNTGDFLMKGLHNYAQKTGGIEAMKNNQVQMAAPQKSIILYNLPINPQIGPAVLYNSINYQQISQMPFAQPHVLQPNPINSNIISSTIIQPPTNIINQPKIVQNYQPGPIINQPQPGYQKPLYQQPLHGIYQQQPQGIYQQQPQGIYQQQPQGLYPQFQKPTTQIPQQTIYTQNVQMGNPNFAGPNQYNNSLNFGVQPQNVNLQFTQQFSNQNPMYFNKN